MAEKDQEFLEYIVKNIVDKPESVIIDRTIDERGVLLKLTVDPEDMGKIIGKAGATAKAIRTLLRVLGAKCDARFNLKIVEPGDDTVSNNTQKSSQGSVEKTKQADTSTPSTESSKEEEKEDSESNSLSAKAREGIEDLDVEI